MRVLFSGGGTGGHVYPGLAVACALVDGTSGGAGASASELHSVLYVGSRTGVEEQLVRRAGISFAAIDTGQLRGRAPWTVAANLWRMQRGVREARHLIQDFRPDVVFITGGYVAAPVGIAARWVGVPLLIYLPDLTPGLAVRLLSRLAQRVAVSFPPAARHFSGKAVVTGYPVRAELLTAAADRVAARKQLGIQDDRPVLLVMGGSHGARSINRTICAALPRLLKKAHLIHISGYLDWPWVRQRAQELPDTLRSRYHPYAYLHEELPYVLAAADLIVNRAGASNLGELPAVGTPAVLVPYPHAGYHQWINASFLAEHGAARLVEDRALPDELVSTILTLLDDTATRQRMAEAARALARANAVQNIVHLMYEMARTAR